MLCSNFRSDQNHSIGSHVVALLKSNLGVQRTYFSLPFYQTINLPIFFSKVFHFQIQSTFRMGLITKRCPNTVQSGRLLPHLQPLDSILKRMPRTNANWNSQNLMSYLCYRCALAAKSYLEKY